MKLAENNNLEGQVIRLDEHGYGLVEVKNGDQKETLFLHAKSLEGTKFDDLTIGTRVLVEAAGISLDRTDKDYKSGYRDFRRTGQSSVKLVK